jgi:hypothetical protein
MICDGVLWKENGKKNVVKKVEEQAYLDDLEKFFRPIYTSNRKFVKQLHWRK